jgi:hypothetical protein
MALTHTLTTLVDTIGLTGTMLLVRSYAGRGIYVPCEVDERHPLTLCVGLSAARGLCRIYAGRLLDVPAERTLLLALRNREIVRRVVEEHHTVCATAAAFGVSRRWVNRVLAEAGHTPQNVSPPNARAVDI